jgi:hypothetical protein
LITCCWAMIVAASASTSFAGSALSG